jgi:hypothetical protein
MSARRNDGKRVCAVKPMRINLAAIAMPAAAIAATLICLGSVSTARGAAETKLKEVNTSIGVLPTNSTNEWKLITDPSITTPNPGPDGAAPFDPSLYLPISGVLANTYDPTKQHLATNADGQYATGVSVEGILPFQVLGFDVLMNGGGNILVEVDPSNPAADIVTPTGDVTDGEKGEVDDIQYALIGDLRGTALTADQDQNFFDLVLINNEGVNGPPQGSVIPGPGGEVTLGPVDPTNPNSPINVVLSDINPNSTPEPGSALLMLVSAGFMGLRRRKSSIPV